MRAKDAQGGSAKRRKKITVPERPSLEEFNPLPGVSYTTQPEHRHRGRRALDWGVVVFGKKKNGKLFSLFSCIWSFAASTFHLENKGTQLDGKERWKFWEIEGFRPAGRARIFFPAVGKKKRRTFIRSTGFVWLDFDGSHAIWHFNCLLIVAISMLQLAYHEVYSTVCLAISAWH